MEQPISHYPGSSLPWLIRGRVRIAAAIVVAVIAYLLTKGLPDELNLLIPYDLGVAIYMALFGVLMERASPETDNAVTRKAATTVAFRGAKRPKLAKMIVSQKTKTSRKGKGMELPAFSNSSKRMRPKSIAMLRVTRQRALCFTRARVPRFCHK